MPRHVRHAPDAERIVCRACGRPPPLDLGWTLYPRCRHVVCDRCRVAEPYQADRRWRCPVCRGRVARSATLATLGTLTRW